MPRPSGTVQMPRRARPSAESRRHHLAVEVDLTGGRCQCPGTDVEHGGLAAPVRTEQGDNGACRDGQVHAVHDLDRSVPGADVLEFQDGVGRGHAVPRYACTTAGSFFTSSGEPLAMICP